MNNNLSTLKCQLVRNEVINKHNNEVIGYRYYLIRSFDNILKKELIYSSIKKTGTLTLYDLHAKKIYNNIVEEFTKTS